MNTNTRKTRPVARPFQRDLQFARLLRRTSLLPEESLPSLLARLTVLNGYDSLRNIGWLAGEDWYTRRRALAKGTTDNDPEGRVMDNPSLPEMPATYARLSLLTGLSAIELYKASAHSFTLVPIGQPLRTISLPGGGQQHILPLLPTSRPGMLVYNRDLCYCPLCLAREPYHRRVWLSKECAVCLEHKVLLVKGCHACGAKVSMLEIVKAQCGRCGTNLSDAPTVDISADRMGLLAQHVIQAGLLGQQVEDKVALRHGIPIEPSPTIYRFLHGLTINIARKVRKLGKSWTYLHSLDICSTNHTLGRIEDSKKEYELCATALKALLEWPSGFHVFLDEYRTAQSTPRIDSSLVVLADLGALYSTWLNWHWQQPEYSFVQKAFDQYLLDRQAQLPNLTNTVRYQNDATFASNVQLVPVDIAMEVLGLGREAVYSLARAAWLRNNSVRTRPMRSHLLIYREQLQELADRWRGCLPMPAAALHTGIPGVTLVQLVKTGFVAAVSGPVVDRCPIWMFHKDELEQCLQRIMGKAVAVRNRKIFMLDLTQAARKYMLTPTSFPVVKAELLRKVADGTLRAYVPTSTPGVKLISSLLFSEEDIIALRTVRSLENARSVSC